MPVHTQEIAVLDNVGNPVGAQTFGFVDLVGVPILASASVEVLARRGVDGVGLRVGGTRPQPFTLQSVAYPASFSIAKSVIANYKATKGAEYGVRLTLNSVVYGTFDVIAVEEKSPPRAVLVKVGGQAGLDGVRQACAWTLIERTGA